MLKKMKLIVVCQAIKKRCLLILRAVSFELLYIFTVLDGKWLGWLWFFNLIFVDRLHVDCITNREIQKGIATRKRVRVAGLEESVIPTAI